MIRLYIIVTIMIFSAPLSGAVENLASEKRYASKHTPTSNTDEPKQTTHKILPIRKESISNVSRPVDTRQTDSTQSKQNEGTNESWWFKFRTDPVATFTFLLFIATGLLWWATRKLVLGAENTASQQLRAYVFAKPDEPVSIDPNGCLCAPIVIKNFGQTPANEVRCYVSIGLYRFPLDVVLDHLIILTHLHPHLLLVKQLNNSRQCHGH